MQVAQFASLTLNVAVAGAGVEVEVEVLPDDVGADDDVVRNGTEEAAVDDACASCGTVTTTVAPAGAATGADGDALTDAEEAVPDADVEMVQPVRPAPSNATISGAHRHADRAEETVLMPCSYTRPGSARGTPVGASDLKRVTPAPTS